MRAYLKACIPLWMLAMWKGVDMSSSSKSSWGGGGGGAWNDMDSIYLQTWWNWACFHQWVRHGRSVDNTPAQYPWSILKRRGTHNRGFCYSHISLTSHPGMANGVQGTWLVTQWMLNCQFQLSAMKCVHYSIRLQWARIYRSGQECAKMQNAIKGEREMQWCHHMCHNTTLTEP